MKLKSKINIASIGLTLLILMSSFTGIYFLYEQLAITSEAEQLQARALELTTAISALEKTEGIDTILNAFIPTNGAIIIRDENNELVTRVQRTGEKIDFATNSFIYRKNS